MKKYLVLILLYIFAFNIYATEKFQLKPLNVLNSEDSYPWAKVELLVDKSEHFKQERYHEKTKVTHTKYLKLLKGNDSPHSKYFIMHYSTNWNSAKKRPVLLVHGAGDQAFRAWSHPFFNELNGDNKIDFPGFMQRLVEKGYPVFAITFPHNHGDNFFQAEHIANAISKIKEVLKKESDENFKVDVIAHSKGGVSTRMYISNIKDEYPEYSWMTSFRKDVNKFISVATPLKGVDTMFRYYLYNVSVVQSNMAAPVGVKTINYFMQNLKMNEHNSMFIGQYQILHNWVNDKETPIAFNYESATLFDYNLTRNKLYSGGTTFYISSIGINNGMKIGKNLIEKLNEKGADPSVKIAAFGGNNQALEELNMIYFKLAIGEKADDSDGLLFLKSATYTKGICRRGAKLIYKKVLPLHHLAISCATIAFNEVYKVLEM